MRFLVGLDGSPEAEAGLDVLAALPARASNEAIVLSVAQTPIGLGGLAGPPEAVVWYDEIRKAALDQCREVAEAGASRLAPSMRAIPMVAEGHPLQVMERVAKERAADVVVVGPHGRGRTEQLLMGSVSQGLHWLREPVLVARPVQHAMRSVIVAVDGSVHAVEAAKWLARLSLGDDTCVTLVTVLPEHTGPLGRAWSDELYPQVVAAESDAAERSLDEVTAVLADKGIATERRVLHGPPKRVLIETAGALDADLIVMGARGLGGFSALILGSVSRAVTKAAPCSVLVVHRD